MDRRGRDAGGGCNEQRAFQRFRSQPARRDKHVNSQYRDEERHANLPRRARAQTASSEESMVDRPVRGCSRPNMNREEPGPEELQTAARSKSRTQPPKSKTLRFDNNIDFHQYSDSGETVDEASDDRYTPFAPKDRVRPRKKHQNSTLSQPTVRHSRDTYPMVDPSIDHRAHRRHSSQDFLSDDDTDIWGSYEDGPGDWRTKQVVLKHGDTGNRTARPRAAMAEGSDLGSASQRNGCVEPFVNHRLIAKPGETVDVVSSADERLPDRASRRPRRSRNAETQPNDSRKLSSRSSKRSITCPIREHIDNPFSGSNDERQGNLTRGRSFKGQLFADSDLDTSYHSKYRPAQAQLGEIPKIKPSSTISHNTTRAPPSPHGGILKTSSKFSAHFDDKIGNPYRSEKRGFSPNSMFEDDGIDSYRGFGSPEKKRHLFGDASDDEDLATPARNSSRATIRDRTKAPGFLPRHKDRARDPIDPKQKVARSRNPFALTNDSEEELDNALGNALESRNSRPSVLNHPAESGSATHSQALRAAAKAQSTTTPSSRKAIEKIAPTQLNLDEPTDASERIENPKSTREPKKTMVLASQHSKSVVQAAGPASVTFRNQIWSTAARKPSQALSEASDHQKRTGRDYQPPFKMQKSNAGVAISELVDISDRESTGGSLFNSDNGPEPDHDRVAVTKGAYPAGASQKAPDFKFPKKPSMKQGDSGDATDTQNTSSNLDHRQPRSKRKHTSLYKTTGRDRSSNDPNSGCGRKPAQASSSNSVLANALMELGASTKTKAPRAEATATQSAVTQVKLNQPRANPAKATQAKATPAPELSPAEKRKRLEDALAEARKEEEAEKVLKAQQQREAEEAKKARNAERAAKARATKARKAQEAQEAEEARQAETKRKVQAAEAAIKALEAESRQAQAPEASTASDDPGESDRAANVSLDTMDPIAINPGFPYQDLAEYDSENLDIDGHVGVSPEGHHDNLDIDEVFVDNLAHLGRGSQHVENPGAVHGLPPMIPQLDLAELGIATPSLYPGISGSPVGSPPARFGEQHGGIQGPGYEATAENEESGGAAYVDPNKHQQEPTVVESQSTSKTEGEARRKPGRPRQKPAPLVEVWQDSNSMPRLQPGIQSAPPYVGGQLHPSIPTPTPKTACATIDEQDKMIVTLRDMGLTWKEVNILWRSKTGKVLKDDSLPGRYNRVKRHFSIPDPPPRTGEQSMEPQAAKDPRQVAAEDIFEPSEGPATGRPTWWGKGMNPDAMERLMAMHEERAEREEKEQEERQQEKRKQKQAENEWRNERREWMANQFVAPVGKDGCWYEYQVMRREWTAEQDESEVQATVIGPTYTDLRKANHAAGLEVLESRSLPGYCVRTTSSQMIHRDDMIDHQVTSPEGHVRVFVRRDLHHTGQAQAPQVYKPAWTPKRLWLLIQKTTSRRALVESDNSAEQADSGLEEDDVPVLASSNADTSDADDSDDSDASLFGTKDKPAKAAPMGPAQTPQQQQPAPQPPSTGPVPAYDTNYDILGTFTIMDMANRAAVKRCLELETDPDSRRMDDINHRVALQKQLHAELEGLEELEQCFRRVLPGLEVEVWVQEGQLMGPRNI